jgi:hypothetical protein
VHTGAEAGIPDQLIGGFETGDIANGGENGHPHGEANPWYLQGNGHGIPPLGGIAEGSDLSVQLPDQRLEMVEDIQVVAEEDFFGWGEGDGIPPGEVLVGEGFAGWEFQHVTMEQALKTITGHGLDPNQAPAMGQEAAGFADMGRGHPNLRDETGCAKLGELNGVVFVGLDAGFIDPRELSGVGDLDPGDEVDDAVEEIPGISCGFDSNDVGRVEMVASPIGLVFEGNF